jgi:hypothetical protein
VTKALGLPFPVQISKRAPKPVQARRGLNIKTSLRCLQPLGRRYISNGEPKADGNWTRVTQPPYSMWMRIIDLYRCALGVEMVVILAHAGDAVGET